MCARNNVRTETTEMRKTQVPALKEIIEARV